MSKTGNKTTLNPMMKLDINCNNNKNVKRKKFKYDSSSKFKSELSVGKLKSTSVAAPKDGSIDVGSLKGEPENHESQISSLQIR